MPCPAGVNIPQNFTLWNKYHIYGTYDHVKNAWEKDLKDEEKAKCCVKCGKCEKSVLSISPSAGIWSLHRRIWTARQRHRSKRTAVAAAQKWADRVTNKERYRFL